MLIKCPKCRSVYDLPDNLINNDGLKMRCSQCSEIWIGYPEDALKKVSVTPKSIQKMFKMISKDTDPLFEDTKTETAPVEKIKIVNTYKKTPYTTIILVSLVILLFSLLLYAFRYDIVRILPQTERLYSKINITSIPYGSNLEFNNISTKEYIENNISKIEINGMITNKGKYVTKLPPIKIDIYNKNGTLLLTLIEKLPLPRLEAGYNILFNKTINNPTPLAKSIYVSLEDKLEDKKESN